MKKIICSVFTLSILLGMNACKQKENGKENENRQKAENTLLAESKAPFGAPEFDKFKIEDYKPAFDQAFAEKRADIKKIIENKEAPTYANTVEALELSGKNLEKVSSIFFNLNESENTPQMTEIEEYAIPKMTDLNGYIFMNDTLFSRIRALYDSRNSLGLDEEQMIVDPDERYGRLLMREILLAGNFGKQDTRFAKIRGACSMSHINNLLKRYRILLGHYPSETIFSPFFKIWHTLWRKKHKSKQSTNGNNTNGFQ